MTSPVSAIEAIEKAMEGVTHPDAPEWIAVAQDGDGPNGGFWTCAAATTESPRYIRADIYAALARQAEALQRENAEKDVRIAALEGALEESQDMHLSALRRICASRDALQKVVGSVLTWAEQQCPCKNEQPNPCPLCGASVENLEPCKSAENTIPRHLLDDLSRVRARALLGGENAE